MEIIDQLGTDTSPRILFNHEVNKFEISGRSIPNNALAIFDPLKHWMEVYLQSNPTAFTLDCNLEYFNTSTQKCLLDFFNMMAEEKDNVAIELNWHYEESDDEMRQIGVVISKLIDLPVNFISYLEEQ